VPDQIHPEDPRSTAESFGGDDYERPSLRDEALATGVVLYGAVKAYHDPVGTVIDAVAHAKRIWDEANEE
jgi:hypothetical protein